MISLTQQPAVGLSVDSLLGRTPGPADELAAERSLRDQIRSIDRATVELIAEAHPKPLDLPAVGASHARLLDLAALEQLRDQLAMRLEVGRRRLSAIRDSEAEASLLVERMMADPAAHRWLRVSRDELGLPGCGHWHSRPRLGLIGMLMGWWHVKISSGCPLAGDSGLRRVSIR